MSGLPDLPPEFGGYFENLRAGRIAFPSCRRCGRFHWYPMKRCPYCYSPELRWSEVAGETTLHSWTSVQRGFSDEFRDKVPYIVGLVDFSAVPGIRLVTNIVEADEDMLAIDMRLEPVFLGQNEAMPSVVFRPAASRAE